MEISKNIVVMYHGNCPDGFGGAFAAWKKFGDKADYIGLVDRINPPDGLKGKEIYLIDFAFPAEVLKKIEQEAKFFIVIDHHTSAREAVQSLKNHVYATEHSGCALAWTYFHPNDEMPLFLQYVEDGDLYAFKVPSARAVLSWMSLQEFDFTTWDRCMSDFENPAILAEYIKKGEGYQEHWEHLLKEMMEDAYLVEFEGYEVFAANASRMFRSDLGSMLAKQKPPFAIIWSYDPGRGIACSLRGHGALDLTVIARKYGGGGHPNAAGFRIPHGSPLPFKQIHQKA